MVCESKGKGIELVIRAYLLWETSYEMDCQYESKGVADKKMTKFVVNAFYYLKSKDYGKININHSNLALE